LRYLLDKVRNYFEQNPEDPNGSNTGE